MKPADVIAVTTCMLVGASMAAVLAETHGASAALQTCRQHLRSQAVAVSQYAEDHGGYLPQAVIRKQPRWTWWHERIRPYMKRYRHYYCPTKTPEEFNEGDRDPLEPEAWNSDHLAYGMNWRLSETYSGQLWRTSDIDNPEHLIVLGDADFLLMRATAALWDNDASDRHDGKANFVFLDQSVRLEDPLVDEYVRDEAEGILKPCYWYP